MDAVTHHTSLKIYTNTIEPKNDGYSVLGLQGNFDDRIYETRGHNDTRSLFCNAEKALKVDPKQMAWDTHGVYCFSA